MHGRVSPAMEPAMERLCWLPDAQRVHEQHELDGPVPATSSSQHLIPHALVRLRQSNDPEASNLEPLEQGHHWKLKFAMIVCK